MPAALRETSDAELRELLERALSEAAGAPRRVALLARRPFSYETSFAIDELEVQVGDGESLRLLVKDVGSGGLSAPAAAAKPAFTLDPGREIVVYRSLLDAADLSTPRFYGAVEDPASGRAWLFLEQVEGEVLADVGDPAAWEAAAAWAGCLDQRLGDRAVDLGPRLVRRDRQWHSQWIRRAVFASSTDGDGELERRLQPAVGAAFLDRLEALPESFVHGELYASNVIVERREQEEVRIAPVDWELAGAGPFALDLAALVSGWRGEERQAMCDAFRTALPPERRNGISRDRLLDAVNLCELSLALQWIGWSQQWLPPAEHRRDWTAEALRLLEETGL
jgi:hypothetical protein